MNWGDPEVNTKGTKSKLKVTEHPCTFFAFVTFVLTPVHTMRSRNALATASVLEWTCNLL